MLWWSFDKKTNWICCFRAAQWCQLGHNEQFGLHSSHSWTCHQCMESRSSLGHMTNLTIEASDWDCVWLLRRLIETLSDCWDIWSRRDMTRLPARSCARLWCTHASPTDLGLKSRTSSTHTLVSPNWTLQELRGIKDTVFRNAPQLGGQWCVIPNDPAVKQQHTREREQTNLNPFWIVWNTWLSTTGWCTSRDGWHEKTEYVKNVSSKIQMTAFGNGEGRIGLKCQADHIQLPVSCFAWPGPLVVYSLP